MLELSSLFLVLSFLLVLRLGKSISSLVLLLMASVGLVSLYIQMPLQELRSANRDSLFLFFMVFLLVLGFVLFAHKEEEEGGGD